VTVLKELIKAGGPGKSSSRAGCNDNPARTLRARRPLEKRETLPPR